MNKIYSIIMALGLTFGNPNFGLAAAKEDPKRATTSKSTAIFYYDNDNYRDGETICLYQKTGRSMGTRRVVNGTMGLRHSIRFDDPDGIKFIEANLDEEYGILFHEKGSKEALIFYMANVPKKDIKTYKEIRITDELDNVKVFRFNLESLINNPISEELITKACK